MNIFAVGVLAAIMWSVASGDIRSRHPRIGISSGYGGAYHTYGDSVSYSYSVPAGSYSAPAFSYYTPAISYSTPGVRYSAAVMGFSAPVYGYASQAVIHNDVNMIADTSREMSVSKEVPKPPAVAVDAVLIKEVSNSAGYTGYGSGMTSGSSIFSDHPGRSGYPGYFGYASTWW